MHSKRSLLTCYLHRHLDSSQYNVPLGDRQSNCGIAIGKGFMQDTDKPYIVFTKNREPRSNPWFARMGGGLGSDICCV